MPQDDVLLPAVAYYRMSDDDQTTSIAQQKREVEAYAALRGYRILREYTDPGKSASKEPEKRYAWQRLLMDCTRPDFQAILCWKSNRFTREDSIDSAFAKRILRDNGIYLDTVKEGKRDFATFEGRLMDFVTTEQDHKYSRDLASDSVRGREDTFRRGKCPYGKISYGYARRYTFNGQATIIKRTEPFRKPRGWETEIIIDEEEAKHVRFIFDTFANDDLSLSALAKILTDNNVPTATGKNWHTSALRYLLTNPGYAGVCVVGACRYNEKRRGKFARFAETSKEGIIPAIVDKDTFDRVQAKFKKRGEGQSIPKGDSYSPLCGLVICGRCGTRMTRDNNRKRGKVYPRYRCDGYNKSPAKGCRGWGVRDSELLPRLCQVLREEVDTQLLRSLNAKPDEQALTEIDIREQERKSLLEKINTAEDRILSVHASLVKGLEKKLIEMRERLEGVEAEIRVLKMSRNQSGLSSLLDWWDGIKGDILDIFLLDKGCDETGAVAAVQEAIDTEPEAAEEIIKAVGKHGGLVEASRFREFLHRIGCQITLYFQPRPGQSRQAKARAAKGEGKGVRRYEVDWERSRIAVGFAWNGGPMPLERVGESDSSNVTPGELPDSSIVVTFDRTFGSVKCAAG